MTHPVPGDIHPHDVADKSSVLAFHAAIAMALQVESDAVRVNTQTFNTNRYRALERLDDYEELKDRARAIKEESLRRLPELVTMLTRAVEGRGGHVCVAATKEEAVEYVRKVCTAFGAKLVVKAKSITSEEIGLNQVLDKENIEVAETDLAEFILQVSHEQPSHIVAPAIHRSRERISQLFKEHFHTELPLETGEELTAFARDILRKKFLAADIGISGANALAAEEGAILLVESEGNIRLTTHLPAVHIAIAGVEKIIPAKRDFGTFIELLAASGTGQPLSTYTNILEPPLLLPVLNLNNREDTRREFHLVLVDNGRTAMRADDGLREALYCIRCSACMNVCANFQAVGGHAFGGECYTGGIGAAWTVGTSGSLEKGRFAELCTGCSRCIPNCPVRIDIPRLNTVIKSRLIEKGGLPSAQKMALGHFSVLARLASVAPALANRAGATSVSRAILENTIGVDRRRKIPPFARMTLVRAYRKHRVASGDRGGPPASVAKRVLFADVFTNFTNPDVGMATVRVFEQLGIPLAVSKVREDGRAALSQGLLPSAIRSARRTAAYLARLIDAGADIIVAEPSVLAMFRQDYKGLIADDALFGKLVRHTFDPIEYLSRCVREGKLDITRLRQRVGSSPPRLFYHGHCQMKSIGLGTVTPAFLRSLGWTVEESSVECCGMAGSFGYKKEYYEISKNVGHDLMRQVYRFMAGDGDMILLASGTSCREQIAGEGGVKVRHPVEFLDSCLSS